MSLKRKQSPDAISPSDVYRSAPIEDRDSKFVGFYSPTLKPKDLQNLPEIKSASHRILGWRRESNQQSINKQLQYVTGSDDDGEKYGGKKVEKVMDATRAVGSCVVARWYGGQMLGPVRFTHIEQCARNAIRQWEDHEREEHSKRRKIEEDKVEHSRLAKSLQDRDQSIVVLRALAADKERRAKVETPDIQVTEVKETRISTQSIPPNATDYSAMPIERLRALDKARDATLSFLLKRIDKAEAEINAHSKTVEDPP